ncbi:hypothetical protein ACPPVS_09920 [Cellulomonas sp. McL0617]|uniref:hypothetical protein n=1 Tax=Cellulomonas sp. McL0617 TaxID=3415675 RepID=UPI003CE935FC
MLLLSRGDVTTTVGHVGNDKSMEVRLTDREASPSPARPAVVWCMRPWFCDDRRCARSTVATPALVGPSAQLVAAVIDSGRSRLSRGLS